MSHTYSSNRIHLIFSTKQRGKRLREDIQPKLWAYIAGIARNHKFEALEIGGAEDHCHALIMLPAPMPLLKAVQTLKGCSSKWLNDTGAAGTNFAWQEGYGAFSVSGISGSSRTCCRRPAYPKLKRWANLARPCGTGFRTLRSAFTRP